MNPESAENSVCKKIGDKGKLIFPQKKSKASDKKQAAY